MRDTGLSPQPTVQVLLATYNGQSFLRAQVLSVLQQSFGDLEILVGDDGSTDRTPAIIDELVQEFPERVRVVFRTRVGGPTRNFMRLVEVASAPYIMFCDQDDVWLPEKIALLLSRCRAFEDESPNTPVLVHSDLMIVDSSLRQISPSMFEYQQLNPYKKTLSDLLLNNNVTGCATLINHETLKLAKGSDPDVMLMHDWWIALVVAAFGRIEVVTTPTVLYRQHGDNVFGAKPPAGSVYYAKRVFAVLRGGKLHKPLRTTLRQAEAFTTKYGHVLRDEERARVHLIGTLTKMSRWELRYALVRHRLLKQGLLGSLVTLFSV